ncbi:uncharacterized protein LOC124897970 [Capsicum annuum]|uniref:uncharacterized protein LOC124897970 n=1 Tax=Capsicum annuum TaxID=4072 RepID=UPI001FB11D15|nr:uncharacterized protein LOC124897970 [Capsicum annuum]
MTIEQRKKEEEHDQDMAYLKTQMDLLTKHLLSAKTEKVKAVTSQGRPVGKPIVDIVVDDIKEVEIVHLVESEKSDEVIDNAPSNSHQVDELEKNKGKKAKLVVTSLPKLPPPFPHQLKKKADNTKFGKFMAMLKQLMINLPLAEALEQIPRNVKFMKDLIMTKRSVSFELMDNLHYCGAIFTRSLVQKKADLGAFTIPCTIKPLDFAKALCDLGESINLMPLAVYKKLGLGDLTPTNM